jgi:hypothetical protein
MRFVRPWVTLKQPASVVDYGCGQSHFIEQLCPDSDVKLARYDPAIPVFSVLPSECFDLLVNIDVLEHVEASDLDTVIGEMRSLCREAIIIIDTKAAQFQLPDGRNAHVTLRSREWWQAKLAEHFPNVEPIRTMRRSRVGFKTWSSSPTEWHRYYRLLALETAAYYSRRLVGRHKPLWRSSSTRARMNSSQRAQLP